MNGWETIRLRRDGMPPLRFSGRLIARHPAPPGALSHGMALYDTVDAGYAVEIAAWSEGRPARCHAAVFGGLEPALAMLEGHDATADICPPLLDGAMPAAELALRAAALRALCRDVEARYRAGVGAFLAAVALKEAI
jgi:hypothetical protein